MFRNAPTQPAAAVGISYSKKRRRAGAATLEDLAFAKANLP
jgi:hypothetical protein